MENNKLIAEFMGFQETSIGWYDADECLHEKDNTFDTLRFDVDWNWLMPVVERIEQVIQGVPQQMLHLSLYSTIDEVYQAVVGFIKWYNNNN
jgi:hypothetical protein